MANASLASEPTTACLPDQCQEVGKDRQVMRQQRRMYTLYSLNCSLSLAAVTRSWQGFPAGFTQKIRLTDCLQLFKQQGMQPMLTRKVSEYFFLKWLYTRVPWF